MPEPDPALLAGKLFYVDEARPGGRPHLKQALRGSSRSRNSSASAARSRSKPMRSICSRRQGRRARPFAAAGTGVERDAGTAKADGGSHIQASFLLIGEGPIVQPWRWEPIARAPHPPALNPHLTKSRLNDALHLCEMFRRNLRRSSCAGRRSKSLPAGNTAIERCLEGEQGGTSLDARRMSTSTSACYGFAASSMRDVQPGKPPLTIFSAAPPSPAWCWAAPGPSTPMFSAPASIRTSSSANFDAPVVKRRRLCVRNASRLADSTIAAWPNAAGDFRARNGPAGSIAFVRRPLRSGGAARRGAVEAADRRAETGGSAEVAN